MRTFRLKAVNKHREQTVFLYSKEDNYLAYDNGQKVVEQARLSDFLLEVGTKSFTDNRSLNIRFAGDCNYRCGYCIQTYLRDDTELWGDVKEFLKLIPPSKTQHRHFELWGGEPFLYWDRFVEISSALRDAYPEASIFTSTNGSLLTYDCVDYLFDKRIAVGISHDGPGQHIRHRIDYLLDPEYRNIIRYAFNLLSTNGCISFNPVLTPQNNSRLAILRYFDSIFGDMKPIMGEGMLIHPSCAEAATYCFASFEKSKEYMLQFLQELRNPGLKRFSLVEDSKQKALRYLHTQQKYQEIHAACGMNLPNIINCSVKGELFICKSGVADKARNVYGSLRNPEQADFSILGDRYYNAERCSNCLVEHFCGRGCAITPPEVIELTCIARYSDFVPIFVSLIEDLTGYVVYLIEDADNPQRLIFGTEDYKELTRRAL